MLAGVAIAGAFHLEAEATALFVMTAGGAALLADADTEDSAIYEAGGKLGWFPLWLARRVVRDKHRGPTHSPFVLACVTGAVLILAVIPVAKLGPLPADWPMHILVPVLLAALCARTVFMHLVNRTHRRFIVTLVAALTGYLGYKLGLEPHFALGLALAIGAGYATHLFTDAGTERGIPLEWPKSYKRYRYAGFKVYGIFDHLFGLLFFAGAIALLWHNFHVDVKSVHVPDVRHTLCVIRRIRSPSPLVFGHPARQSEVAKRPTLL